MRRGREPSLSVERMLESGGSTPASHRANMRHKPSYGDNPLIPLYYGKPRHDVRYAGVHLSRPYPINVVSLSNKAA